MAIFTKTYVGATSLVIEKKDGFNYISIQVDGGSTASAEILGTANLSDATPSGNASITAGNSLSFVRQDAYPLEFTLTIPSGCTVYFVAY